MLVLLSGPDRSKRNGAGTSESSKVHPPPEAVFLSLEAPQQVGRLLLIQHSCHCYSKMADLESVLADVSYLMAMERSKAPGVRAVRKFTLPDKRSAPL